MIGMGNSVNRKARTTPIRVTRMRTGIICTQEEKPVLFVLLSLYQSLRPSNFNHAV